jgi:hypothetical protein
MGSAAGVVDARGHLIRAVLGQFDGTAGVLAGRVRTALALLRTLLVLDDAALLSSPMEVRFAIRCGPGAEGKEGERTAELVGAALDMFLIERDPAKYDALRYVRVMVVCVCMYMSGTLPLQFTILTNACTNTYIYTATRSPAPRASRRWD